MESSSTKVKPIIDSLEQIIEGTEKILSKGNISIGRLKLLSVQLINKFAKIYGTEHEVTKSFRTKQIPDNINAQKELERQVQLLKSYVSVVEQTGINLFIDKNLGGNVFIGHGQSSIWLELKNFLSGRLGLPCDEFNQEPAAGLMTFERISNMLNSASFAFLVMTGEDQHSDTSTHARQNVVHELGLFQGKLGPKKAIILLEEECSEFSNIIGMSQIRFPKDNISAKFEEIREVLEREGLIKRIEP